MSENNKKKASDLFVQALEAEGVDHIFAVPGEENFYGCYLWSPYW